MSDAEVVVLMTCATEEEAAAIARTLVEERLIACANIVPGIRSFFVWDGRTQDARETLLICKSTRPAFPRLQERVTALHSYTVPEIIAVPVVAGLPAYLAWVRDSVRA